MFNWVDLAILATLIFFALESLGRPLILELLDLISFLLAFFLSFSLYNFPAKLLETQFKISHGLSLVLGFMTVWFLTETIFYMIVQILFPKLLVLRSLAEGGRSRLKLKVLGSKFLSIIPATLRGLIFIAFLLVMIATFPIQPSIKKAVLDSQVGSRILNFSYALEQPVKNVFGGVTNDSLTFLTIKPQTSEKINLGFQTTKFTTDQKTEIDMIELVNKERTSRGIKALAFDEGLRAIARGHSADMFTRGYFSHYSPDPDSIGAEGFSVADRISKAGIDYLVVGENLAYAPNLESAHKGLMNSPGHKANILSTDYNKIGIGVMDGGVYEEMFTQVFSN